MTPPRTIASVERVAQHRNGPGAEPYLSVHFTDEHGCKLHAAVFEPAGHLAVFAVDDPTRRIAGDWYEADLRTVAAEVGLPYNNDPLRALRDHAAVMLTRAVEVRDAAPVDEKTLPRGIARNLERALRYIDAAMERAKA